MHLRLALLAAGLEPRRRGDRPRADLRRDARGGDAGRRQARPRRCPRRRLHARRRRRRGRDRTAHAGGAAGAPLRPDGGHEAARRARTSARPRPAGGCVPGPRRDAATGSGPARSAPPAPSASIPARTWARWATPALSSRADEQLASRLRALREHGQTRKYEHAWEGYTARLDTIQAAVLLRKLPLLARLEREPASRCPPLLGGACRRRRPRSCRPWRRGASRSGISTSSARRIRSPSADSLGARGIGTGRHYPQPVHLATAYAWLGYAEGDFEVAERLAQESISLPIYPGITERAGRDGRRRGAVDFFAGG